MAKTKLEQLSLEQKNSLRDQIDNFRLQLIAADSEVQQFNFDIEYIVDMIKIKRKQNLKKIERLKLNIKALERQIRIGVQVPEESGGEKNMAEDEEKKEGEEAKEEEKSESESSEEEAKEDSEESSKEKAEEESSKETSDEEGSSEESSEDSE